jgi:hypothetical protein
MFLQYAEALSFIKITELIHSHFLRLPHTRAVPSCFLCPCHTGATTRRPPPSMHRRISPSPLPPWSPRHRCYASLEPGSMAFVSLLCHEPASMAPPPRACLCAIHLERLDLSHLAPVSRSPHTCCSNSTGWRCGYARRPRSNASPRSSSFAACAIAPSPGTASTSMTSGNLWIDDVLATSCSPPTPMRSSTTSCSPPTPMRSSTIRRACAAAG